MKLFLFTGCRGAVAGNYVELKRPTRGHGPAILPSDAVAAFSRANSRQTAKLIPLSRRLQCLLSSHVLFFFFPLPRGNLHELCSRSRFMFMGPSQRLQSSVSGKYFKNQPGNGV